MRKTSQQHPLSKARLLIVKLGTGVLTSGKGHIHPARIQKLAAQIRKVRKKNVRVVLVSSGAIGAGMAKLNLKTRPSHLHHLQACAAIGQNLLMHHYETAFSHLGIVVGQVLLTHGDLRDRKRRDNARATLKRLLDLNVVPIINENDAVSTAEIRFGDNDQLSAQVHELLGADVTVLLSTVEGFYVREGKKEVMLREVHGITPTLLSHAGDSVSHRSLGGMRSKLLAAKIVNTCGNPLIVAGGMVRDIIPRLLAGEKLGTHFLPKRRSPSVG